MLAISHQLGRTLDLPFSTIAVVFRFSGFEVHVRGFELEISEKHFARTVDATNDVVDSRAVFNGHQLQLTIRPGAGNDSL